MIRGGERDPQPPAPEGSAAPAAAEVAAEEDAQLRRQREALRRRLDEIFGPRLPEQTSDDLEDPADRRPAANGDDWLLRQVPPHHG